MEWAYCWIRRHRFRVFEAFVSKIVKIVQKKELSYFFSLGFWKSVRMQFLFSVLFLFGVNGSNCLIMIYEEEEAFWIKVLVLQIFSVPLILCFNSPIVLTTNPLTITQKYDWCIWSRFQRGVGWILCLEKFLFFAFWVGFLV